VTPIADTTRYVATHGSPWDYDRRVPILFWWPGVTPETRTTPIETVDIAPTLAAAAGVQTPKVDGKCLAHGANPKQVGKDLIDLTDVDGKYFIKERVQLVKSKPAGVWQDYKFTNPVTKKIEPKQLYCEKLAETAVCAGVYK